MNEPTAATAEAALTVSEVSRLAGVSVRALHHYDEIGLLVPSARTEAGYRLYSREDLDRLQEILLFRELEIPLEDIAVLLAGGAFDRRAALELQRELLMQKAVRTEALITSVERAINAERTGVRMTKEETFEVFGDFDPAEYEDEVKERWGETDAYKESARRTARYTKADWERFRAESQQIGTDTARLMDEGVPPTDPRDCRFGQWLRGDGRVRYSGIPAFEQVVERHLDAHRCGQELLTLRAESPVAARARISELHRCRTRLLDSLHHLHRAVMHLPA